MVGSRVATLSALLLIVGLLFAVPVGRAATQSFTDPEGDSSAGAECDIVAAAVANSAGKLAFSITVVEPISSRLAAPWVQIYKKPAEINRGMPPPAELSGTAIPRVPLQLSNERRTATYRIKPAKLRTELGVSKKQKRFFWVARECFMHPDYAPDRGPEKPRVVGHPF